MGSGLSLLADIGGTNTRVALASGTRVLPDTIRRFPNAEYQARGQDIAQILRDYLAQGGAQGGAAIQGLCVAAAGPVQDGVATMTNLDWTMDAAKLQSASGAVRVEILNDLQAQGHALGHIAAENLRPVIDGPQAPGAPMLVVGLGTGVNAAPVHGHGARRVVPPSECGHVNMPVRSEADLRLMRFIEARLAAKGEVPHCGAEEVLAGRGLGNLCAFAASEAGQTDTRQSAEVLKALDTADPIATQAAALYTRILAQVLADLALIHLPYGGIYLIGGMSRAMCPHFARFGLARAFREPRRVDLLTHAFSVTVVEDDYAALTGCAAWLQASA
ncbi:glucokinase [Rhodobacter sp. Har01]|uniref:glucokinase n=1 Tax=Rhodobacter sp. Har01 TaxID=2883999 RepID=UPI001D0849A4|nr:ROK family protein [Rhodobacter sp. Har01]MCB6177248.1 glucokinase [Rhodobacter sp. Har01]